MSQAIVKKGAQYVANYALVNGHFNFKWVRTVERALPMNAHFAAYIAREIQGKVIPILDGEKK